MPTQELEIGKIALDLKMQQRGFISDDVVAQYSEAMLAGDIFPPLEVVEDGKKFWLYDGFHRVKAAHKAGVKMFAANIRPGTKRDAEYLSFSVNARHGLQRPRGALSGILRKILTDPEWSKMPLRQIARHVGCDEKYVRLVRERVVADTPHALQRAEQVTVKTCDGKEYERLSCRKDRPAKVVSVLTQIICRLSEINTDEITANKKINAAIKSLESAKKSLIAKEGNKVET